MNRPLWRSLTGRLTLSFMLLTVLSLGLVGLLSYLSVREGYRQLTSGQIQASLKERLQEYVRAHGSVSGYRVFQDGPGGPAAAAGPGPGDPSGQGRPPPQASPLGEGGSPPLDEGGPFRVLDAQYRLLGGDGRVWPAADRGSAIPVQVDGVTAAYLMPTGHYPPLDVQSAEFLDRVRQAILLVMLMAGMLAVGLGLLLARTLLLPLRQLLGGIEAMQRGQPVQVQPSRRNDELDELLRAFHAMTQTVRHNQQLRRQLTADIAHDLNTPLSVISGSLEGMLDGTFQPGRDRLERLQREATHVTTLVRDLRFLALADAGELQVRKRDVDFPELLGDLVTDFRQLAENQEIHLSCHVSDQGTVVPVDPTRMTQVVQNLLSNALAHTPPGGSVEVSGQTRGRFFLMSVQDTGRGISADVLPHVFERLYRADASRTTSGSGLGLTISRSIVEAHGGQIEIASVEGKGTRVDVLLPLR